jgi:dipeptidyl aminopeptidase/acylaminoacyl peptidase
VVRSLRERTMHPRWTAILAIVTAWLAAGTPSRAQERPRLSEEDYGQWESLGATQLSPDGAWLSVEIRRVSEENELRFRALEAESEHVVPFGSQAVFSADGRWAAYRIGLSPDEQENEDAREDVGLLDLRAVTDTTFEDVASFAFSEDGRFLALFRRPREGDGGGDLLIRELAAGTDMALGNVDAYDWSPTGHLMAVIIETASGSGNGVQLYDAGEGTLRSLDRSEGDYRMLTWREDDDDLAVLRSRVDEGFEEDTHVILHWRDVGRTPGPARVFDPGEAEAFPEGMRVAEHRRPRWSEDGGSLFFGIRPRERSTSVPDSAGTEEESAEDDAEVSDVQVWHARDTRIIPMQRAQERRDLERTLLSVWHVDEDRFLQLGTDLMASTAIVPGGRHVTEADDSPYAGDVMFGRVWQDVTVIDVGTGERTPILDRVRYLAGGSPQGRYVLYFRGEDWWAYDIEVGVHNNLTGELDGTFADREYDYPVEQLPPVGFSPAGWVDGDDAVLLRDRFDTWAVSPRGEGGRRLTGGQADNLRHTPVVLDRDQEWFDSREPVYFQLFGERTKQSGFARASLREDGSAFATRGDVERLVLEDAGLARLARAKDAEVYAWVAQRFDDSPDVFVAGPDLSGGRQVTATNPFQDQYAWGRAEVVDFTSRTGVDLQATLLYPAGYEAGRRYPMIVYTYERLSDGLHRYIVPTERSYYNFQVWTQRGYFVLQPDIVYRPREPGVSAVDAVVPAVQRIVNLGMVDPDRVGLVGHSWGGYQATYIPTRTDIFAASVAGAPLTNFLSMMGAVHWRPGLPETGHWETGQARMDVPYWEDFEAHVRNSPAAHIEDLSTPMLMMFGDEDGTVDFRQGVEFYNYARRAGKEFVLLVYPGADHGLRREENQIDYHRRILEWFGHYLQDEPAPEWMSDGLSWLEQKKAAGG